MGCLAEDFVEASGMQTERRAGLILRARRWKYS
jgi:hypothetical protein